MFTVVERCCAARFLNTAILLLFSVLGQAQVSSTYVQLSGETGNNIKNILSHQNLHQREKNRPMIGGETPVSIYTLTLTLPNGKNNDTESVFLPEDILEPRKDQVYSELPFKVISYGGGDQKNSGSSGNNSKDGEKKKKKSKSGTTTTSQASGTLTTSSKPRIQELITELEGIKKKVEKNKKTARQSENINQFKKLLKTWVERHVLLQKVFNTKKIFNGNPSFIPTSILDTLTRKFPNEMKNGKLRFVSLDSMKEIESDLIIPFVIGYLNLAEIVTKDDSTLRGILNETPYWGLNLKAVLSMPPLHRYFIQELNTLLPKETRIYAVRGSTNHLMAVSIRKKDDGSFRILIADSLATFVVAESTRSFSSTAQSVVFALYAALKNTNAADARFYFFPVARQADAETCVAFLVNDVETMLRTPLGTGYFAERVKQVKWELWYEGIKDAINKETGMHVNGKSWKELLPGETYRESLRQTLENSLTGKKPHNTLFDDSPDSYGFYVLQQFPEAFLKHTQGTDNLKYLLSRFTEEQRNRILNDIEQNRDKEHGRNLSASLSWMGLVIEALKELEKKEHTENATF